MWSPAPSHPNSRLLQSIPLQVKRPIMLSSILLLLAFAAVTMGFMPTTNRITRQSAMNAIPSFNWPGSKIPPSNLESLFGGGGGGGGGSSVKSAPQSKAVAAKSGSKPSAGSKSTKKNMTWGGRPDPTPELKVAKEESFFSADWRFNKK